MRKELAYADYADEVLIDLLHQHDRMAFDTIYHRYAGVLYRYAYNILEDDDDCVDVIQDIFVWIWDNRNSLRISKLRPYLFAAVKYRVLRSISASKRRDEILNSIPFQEVSDAVDPLEIKELQQIVSDFVDGLPPQAQRIFRLSREQYLTNKEIASTLNISEKTVENHMTTVLKKLRTHLGKNAFLIFFI